MPKPWRRGTRQRGSVAVTDLTAGPALVAPCSRCWCSTPPSGPDWLHEVKFDGTGWYPSSTKAVRYAPLPGMNQGVLGKP